MGEGEFKSTFVLDFKAMFILLITHYLDHGVDRNAMKAAVVCTNTTHTFTHSHAYTVFTEVTAQCVSPSNTG